MNSDNSASNKGKGLAEVLENKGFFKLWLAQIFSQLADKFFIVLTVYLITDNWAELVIFKEYNQVKLITLLATGVYIANSLPAILFGAFAGIASDIWPRLKVMTLSNYLRVLLSILIPLCLIVRSEFHGVPLGYIYLLIITFSISFLTQFFTPAEQSLIPILVNKDNLLAANSLYQATTMGAAILGFALGNPLLRIMKFIFGKVGINGGEFVLLPICYLIASLVLVSINLKEKVDFKARKNILRELIAGINILKRLPVVRVAIFQLVILYSLMASLYVLAISLATSIPELGPARFGVLLSFSGIGISIGAFFVAEKGHLIQKRRLALLGQVLISFCLLMLAHFEGLLISTLIACSFLGIGASLVAIPAQTIIQERTPKDVLGKVFGLQNNLINIALSLPLAIVGGLVSNFGLSPILWLLAILTLFGAIFKHP